VNDVRARRVPASNRESQKLSTRLASERWREDAETFPPGESERGQPALQWPDDEDREALRDSALKMVSIFRRRDARRKRVHQGIVGCQPPRPDPAVQLVPHQVDGPLPDAERRYLVLACGHRPRRL